MGEKDSSISMDHTGMLPRYSKVFMAPFFNENFNKFLVAGVVNTKVSSKLRNEYCLNDENLLKLCEIGIYLENRYASPRDIEWAVHKVCFEFLN